ncbi:oxidoreductase-like domain-containing protein [Chitinimonas sp. BJYL2]|uniref:oxidoreductase-like domain-containing protein n=1 Tax=Chitinimonas sp. BJYL2 TaxID=2976696 RepID=UPI0022B2F778|nr:oxidoreductase-like domain-containing protein [Chitinimonas sp. BJYL2]
MTDVPAPPQRPIPPDDNLCCKSGCVPCVWDMYDEDLAEYRKALAAWEAAYGPASPPVSVPASPGR